MYIFAVLFSYPFMLLITISLIVIVILWIRKVKISKSHTIEDANPSYSQYKNLIQNAIDIFTKRTTKELLPL